MKRIELRAARNSLNGDDVRQLPGESNVVESKNKIILIPKNVITKLQVTVGSCPPIVFLVNFLDIVFCGSTSLVLSRFPFIILV